MRKYEASACKGSFQLHISLDKDDLSGLCALFPLYRYCQVNFEKYILEDDLKVNLVVILNVNKEKTIRHQLVSRFPRLGAGQAGVVPL